MLRAPNGALTFFKGATSGSLAVGLRLGFAIARRILLVDRLGIAPTVTVAMLDAIVPRFVGAKDAGSYRAKAKAGSAIDVLDIRHRITNDGRHKGLRGSYRGEHCSNNNCGGRAAEELT